MNFFLKHGIGVFFSCLLVFSMNMISKVSVVSYELYLIEKENNPKTDQTPQLSLGLNENENEHQHNNSINEITKHLHHNHYNLFKLGDSSNALHEIIYSASRYHNIHLSISTPPPELI